MTIDERLESLAASVVEHDKKIEDLVPAAEKCEQEVVNRRPLRS